MIIQILNQQGNLNQEKELFKELLLIKSSEKFEFENFKKNNITLLLNKDIATSNKVDGSLKFSPFVYNTKENLGCFFYDFLCGGECGSTNLVFFKKLEGTYVMVNKVQITVN